MYKTLKKLLANFLIIAISISSISTINIANAAFPDVALTNQNYDAIIYLQENEVLQGYSDGTFKPNNNVNRAEFLKIILEGSDIPLNINSNTPFPDVNHQEWYAPYIKKAFNEGWINGYPDGTFKPEQTINKVEALKILGEVQSWQLIENVPTQPYEDVFKKAWHAPYVYYAQERNYLEEKGNFFEPAEFMTRAKISEIIYRTIVSNGEEYTENSTPLPPENNDDSMTDPEITTTANFNLEIPTDFFTNITLNEKIPNKYFKNEVYTISGKTTQDVKQATVILQKITTGELIDFKGEVNNRNFEIPVHFEESGDYLIGIIPGSALTSNAVEISVETELPPNTTSETSEAALTPNIYFENDKTFVGFDTEEKTINKVSFTQGNNNFTYLTRQPENDLQIFYNNFEDFNNSEVTLEIETANLSSINPLEISSDFVKSPIKKFSPIEHSFSEINDELISISVPDTLTTGSKISISATTNTDTLLKGYVIKPDGKVDEVFLSTNSTTESYYGNPYVTAGANINFEYTPESTGRFIIEINKTDGVAVVNHPIYIGNRIPLLPDFFDLNERKAFQGNVNLAQAREDLLSLINQSRIQHGLSPIELSDELNDLAQTHSQDMKDNNYFAHVNLEGKTPNDRRIDAGISTVVGENLARDVSISFIHNGLMRSAGHRDNILDPNWETVGLGIVKDGNHLLISQEFSNNGFSENDLEDFEEELLSEINKLRNENNLDELEDPTNVTEAAQYITNEMINNDKDLDNDLFSVALNMHSVSGINQAIGRIFSNWDEILISILTENESVLTDQQWKNIGIDINIDESGILYTIVILNQS